MRTTTARLVALGLILTACSVGIAEPLPSTTTSTTEPTTTSSTSTTTPTVAPSTTTSLPLAPTSLINGTPIEDPALLDRRVLAVKIDNHPKARPQSGIEQADMVIELMVEGITRFISIWHESDSDYLGPMRSGRPTDPTLLAALNQPTFAISGAQAWVYKILTSRKIHLVGESSSGVFRISRRSAPHNLYVDTNRLRETADAWGYPDDPPTRPLWDFGPMSDYADPVSEVRIDFSGNIVRWTWDNETAVWLRTMGGKESNWRDREGETGRIAVPVMVALYTEQYTADPPGSGTPVPASLTTGGGKAFVFADGRVTEGTWERSLESEWFRLTDANGEIITVPVGKVWVSLVPSHRGLTYSQ